MDVLSPGGEVFLVLRHHIGAFEGAVMQIICLLRDLPAPGSEGLHTLSIETVIIGLDTQITTLTEYPGIDLQEFF